MEMPDFKTLTHQRNIALAGGDALPLFIKNCLNRAAASEFSGVVEDHPIIIGNVLKTLIGDDRGHPSEILLNFLLETSTMTPARRDDANKLNDIREASRGKAVYLADLESAIREGNQDQAGLETGKLLLASDNKGIVLEVLTELAARSPGYTTAFFFHLIRAHAFQMADDSTWSYARTGLEMLFGQPLPHPPPRVDVEPDMRLDLLLSPNRSEWLAFAAVWRLWDGEMVRRDGIRRGLSAWLTACRSPGKSKTPKCRSTTLTLLTQYRNQPGREFIDLAEEVCGMDLPREQRIRRLVTLDAIRYFTKRPEIDNFPLLAQKLDEAMAA